MKYSNETIDEILGLFLQYNAENYINVESSFNNCVNKYLDLNKKSNLNNNYYSKVMNSERFIENIDKWCEKFRTQILTVEQVFKSMQRFKDVVKCDDHQILAEQSLYEQLYQIVQDEKLLILREIYSEV